MEHTKTPFTLQTDGKGFFWIDKLDDDGGFSICNMGDYKNVLADGLFIVRACNCHDELLEALKITENNIETIAAAHKCETYDPWLKVVQNALAHAQEK
jgi:hypothetical protein